MLDIDILKIKYSQEGYLPNYPPHLISDEEMCLAFIDKAIVGAPTGYWYFYDTYPVLNTYCSDLFESEDEYNSFKTDYENLKQAFRYHIARFLSKVDAWKRPLPDWVYSFMVGTVINDSSDPLDKHYLLVGLNRDNIEDEMTAEAELECYRLSKRWVNKLNDSLKKVSISKEMSVLNESEKQVVEVELKDWVGSEYSDIFITRPPTMFGEQTLIKLIRLAEAS